MIFQEETWNKELCDTTDSISLSIAPLDWKRFIKKKFSFPFNFPIAFDLLHSVCEVHMCTEENIVIFFCKAYRCKTVFTCCFSKLKVFVLPFWVSPEKFSLKLGLYWCLPGWTSGFWFCFGFFCARISLKHCSTDIEAKTYYLVGGNAKTKVHFLHQVWLSPNREGFSFQSIHMWMVTRDLTQVDSLIQEVSFFIRSSVTGLQDLDKTLPTDKAQTNNLLSTSQSLTPYRKHFGTQWTD